MTSELDQLLEGAIDLHCHPGPAPFPRAFDIIEGAQHYAEAGFYGAVAKSHHHPSTTDIELAKKHGLDATGFTFYPAITLNAAVGGINPYAVDVAVTQYGAKVVWLPTIAARHHHAVMGNDPTLGTIKYARSTRELLPEPIVDVVDGNGALVPELDQVIELVRDNGATLATGHIAPSEILAVLRRARELGLTRLVVTHASTLVPGATHEEALAMADLGAVIEHVLSFFDPESAACSYPISSLVEWIRVIGPERTTLSSDSGLVGIEWPVPAFRRVCQLLLEAGLSGDEIRTMIVENPRRLMEGAEIAEPLAAGVQGSGAAGSSEARK